MTDQKNKKIFNNLLELQKKAYVPYSKFRVACFLELDNAEMIPGINIENSSFPVTLCAERSACGSWLSGNLFKNKVKNIYLLTDSDNYGSPCGMCRQFLSEIIDENVTVYIFNQKGDFKTLLVKELLPLKFSAKDLSEVS